MSISATFFRASALFLGLSLGVSLGCKDAATATTQGPPRVQSGKAAGAPAPELGPDVLRRWGLEAEDLYYGIYLNGAKIGWMNSQVSGTSEAVTVKVRMEARISGMGTVSQIDLEEERTYRASDGLMVGVDFTQSAATGAVTIKGKLVGEALQLEVTAGEVTTGKSAPARESLRDVLLLHKLVAAPQVGSSSEGVRFDPSALKLLKVTHTVNAIEKRLFGGVEVSTVEVTSVYPEMGMTESSWYDTSGKLLETKVGGFFVARLEPRDVAKRAEYQQDLLISAVVKTPKPIDNAESLAGLEVLFEGFGDFEFPASPRQVAKKAGGRTTLVLTRDEEPPVVSLKVKEPTTEYIAPTPFIQSEAAEIVETAWRTIGNAKDRWTAVQRLVPFVYSHIRDEYVAAFSNAMEALKSGRGDCTEHSVLFVALARAVGIPARTAVGIAYWPAGQGFGWHAWAEVKIGEKWYAVDPTWNQPIADATHIKLAQGGPAEQARVVMLLGRLKVTRVTL